MAYKVFAQDVCALFSHLIFYSLAQISKKAERLIGLKAKPPLQEIVNTNVRLAYEEKNSLEIAKKILRKLENPIFYKKLVKESYNSLGKFYKAALKIKNQYFTKFSSQKIANILKCYLKIWIETIVWGHIINMSDFYFNLLSDKVVNLIEKKIKKGEVKISSVEAFTILTTPTKRSLLLKQDLDLLKLLKEIQKNKKLKTLFLKDKNINNRLKKFSFLAKIKKHTKKYDWLQYHYLGPTILNENYFIEFLKRWIKQKVNAEEKIKEILKKKKETIKKQKEFKKKLRFNQKEFYWIKMAREFCHLKGLRKEITFIACRAYDPLLKEIAKRFSLSLRQLQFMTPDESFNALKGKKLPDLNLLNQRIKYCLVDCPKGKVKVYVGQRAKKLAQKIKEEKVKEETKEFRGTTACPGKAKGRVVIIFEAKDMAKMKKGDILVSPATNPNIMPAIVKASAIITDEGGITCHAAIVSRELGIPCIIGTKIATKVLKDGDLVEIDTEKGLVKIIK